METTKQRIKRSFKKTRNIIRKIGIVRYVKEVWDWRPTVILLIALGAIYGTIQTIIWTIRGIKWAISLIPEGYVGLTIFSIISGAIFLAFYINGLVSYSDHD